MTGAEMEFDARGWHDSLLLGVTIDRRAPGERDEVLLDIEWTDGRRERLRFSGCYGLEAQMNFGIVAPESIRSARCSANSEKLTLVKQKWRGLGVNLDDLRCFEVITNSTASELRVFATGFSIEE